MLIFIWNSEFIANRK